MALHPCLIRQPRRRRCHHQICGFRQARHGHIRLDPCATVQELRIDDLAHRHVIVATADIVHKGLCIAALNADFAKGRHVIHAHIGADRLNFAGDIAKEVLTLPRVFIRGCLPFIRKPVRPLPPGDFTHDGTLIQQMLMERRAAHTARSGLLPEREVVSIKQAQRFL